MSNAMAAVQTWRYNIIVAAAKPVTDRDNGQQPGRGCGTSGGVGAAPGAHPRPATSRPGTSSREQLAQLARVGPAAGHVAGSAATIALVAPRSDDPQLGDLIQFDLVAAADLGIGSAMPASTTRSWRGAYGFPEDRFALC